MVPITIIPVSVWGNFVMALNALLLHAAKCDAAVILFTSVELEMSSAQVQGTPIPTVSLVSGPLASLVIFKWNRRGAVWSPIQLENQMDQGQGQGQLGYLCLNGLWGPGS